jgi:pSer/pThr/pTyr-binding forkhead associated (FHA) protein
MEVMTMSLIIQEFITNGAAFRLWQDYWIAVIGFALAALIAAVVVGSSHSGRGSLLLKGFTILCAAGALPMAMDRIGLGIAMSNYDALAYLNMVASAAAAIVGLPYIIRMNRGKASAEGSDSPGVGTDGKEDGVEAQTMIGKFATTMAPKAKEAMGLSETPARTVFGIPTGLGRNSASSNSTGGSGFSANYGNAAPQRQVASSAPAATMIAQPSRTGGQVIRVPLQATPYSIGRGVASSLVLDDPKVSREHAYVTVENGTYVLKDNNSTNGTYLNGKKVISSPLTPGAKIEIGDSVTIFDPEGNSLGISSMERGPAIGESQAGAATIVRPTGSTIMPVLLAKSGPAKGQHFTVASDAAIIGRSSESDVQIVDKAVSRYQAKMTRKGDIWTVYHAGGSAATQINGKEITGATLKDGDSFTIGASTLVYHQIHRPEQEPETSLTNMGTIVAAASVEQGILTVTAGPDAGSQFVVKQGQNIIGRGSESDVLIQDAEVSREHCSIRSDASGCTLFDFGSTSGTYSASRGGFLKGTDLANGDTLSIGKSDLLVTLM